MACHGLFCEGRHSRIELDRDDARALAGHHGRECPGPRPNLQDQIGRPNPGCLHDQLVDVQIDEKVLPHPVPGREATPSEETAEVGLSVACHGNVQIVSQQSRKARKEQSHWE